MLIGFIVPEDSSTIASLLGNISEVILRVGRYAVFPLFFCEIVLGIYHLRRRAIVRMYGQTFLLAGAISIVMVIIGVISILTIDQLRIPPVIQTLSHAEEFSASAFALGELEVSIDDAGRRLAGWRRETFRRRVRAVRILVVDPEKKRGFAFGSHAGRAERAPHRSWLPRFVREGAVVVPRSQVQAPRGSMADGPLAQCPHVVPL